MRAVVVRRRHGIIAALSCAVSLHAQALPSTKDVLSRVGGYVDAYGERASIVVSTERYVQHTTGNTSAPHLDRAIVAEFAIVKVDAIDEWLGFRDVIEVDGKRLPDHEDRLVRTLTNGSAGYNEARRLSDEGARYNIGSIERNFNVPTTALFYFRRENQDHFKFRAKEVDKSGAWHIAWTETYRPTFIRTPDGESVPSDGDIWVNPADGTILRTILRTNTVTRGFAITPSRVQRMSGQVEVTYKFVEPLAMWLPDVMTEMFEARRSDGAWERVEGRSEYSDYRQFTTSVRIK